VFRVLPPEAESVSTANQQFLETTIKVIKVIVYLLTFIIVLTSGVIAKGSILFMTSQLRPDKNIPYCNVDIGKIPFKCLQNSYKIFGATIFRIQRYFS
jgi:chitin synthase